MPARTAGSPPSPFEPWPVPLVDQASAISAAITTYKVPTQVFMGMYDNETTLGANISNSTAGAVGPFQFLPSTASSYGYPLTNTPNLSEFQQQAKAAAHYLSVLFNQLHDWSKALERYSGNTAGYAAKALAFQIPADWAAALGNPVPLPGGTGGAGGSGSLLNDQATFTVGDPSNPDEDYWTAINRLAQERYWYVFSDGETLYLSDGPDLMGQTPATTVDRVADADRLIHLDLTWDNTAWQYVSTHRKRQRTQRRTTLAKVTSPVQGNIQLISAIDEVRAGDTNVLVNCGPGDGAWLVGDCRRSAFSIYSEITLVQALLPISEQQLGGLNPKNKGTTPVPAGGGRNPAPGATWSRLDMGFDGNYDMSLGAVAPYDGTVYVPGIRGWPGQGIYFWIKNDNQSGPDYTRGMYFAEGALPLVPNGTHVTAGQRIGLPVSSGGDGQAGNFEIGPANTSNGDTLAKSYGLGSAGARGMVLAFADWLVSLGANKPTSTSNAGSA